MTISIIIRAKFRCACRLMAHRDMQTAMRNVCFSNRPFEVKHFQTIHQCGVDVAGGLVLLFGIGTGAFPSSGFEDEAEQSVSRPCR